MNSSKVNLSPYKLQARGTRIEKLDPWFNTLEQENIGSRSKYGIMDYHQRWYEENMDSRPKIGVDIGHADYLIPSRQIGLDLISFKSTCAKKKSDRAHNE